MGLSDEYWASSSATGSPLTVDGSGSIRKVLVRAATKLGVRKELRTVRDGLVWFLNGEGSAASVWRNRRDNHHLKLLLKFGMRSSSNFLDVGANIGFFLRGIDRLSPNGHHIAYEPVPSLCERLRHEFPAVEIRQAVLSNINGTTSFLHVIGDGNQGFSKLMLDDTEVVRGGVELPSELIEVRTERLDDHRPEGWLPDFVKIDVEGAELSVVEGALETLRRARPVVAVEHVWNAQQSPELYDLFTKELGLRGFDMDGRGPLGRSEFLQNVQKGDRWNWIFHQ